MIKIGAFNTQKPVFFNVLIKHRVTTEPFCNDKMREYYVELLRENAGLPISTIAFALAGQDVRLVVGSNDYTANACREFCVWLTETYTNELFHNIYPDTGRIFEAPVIHKLFSKDSVLRSINNVHSSAAGSAFSSYNEYDPENTSRKVSNADLVWEMYGRDAFSKIKPPTKREFKLENIPLFQPFKFKRLVKKVAESNGITIKKYPLEPLPVIFYEVMGLTGCPFDNVAEIFKLSDENRMKVIEQTIKFYWDNGNKCHQIVNGMRLSDFHIKDYLINMLVNKGYVEEIVVKNFETGKM